jgi:hypothetical protein
MRFFVGLLGKQFEVFFYVLLFVICFLFVGSCSMLLPFVLDLFK